MGQMTSAPQADQNNDGSTWWCKLLARIIGVVGALICLISGVFTILGFSVLCIISGVLMFVAGAVVLIFEAPICCSFIEMTQPIARFAENRTFFQKGFLYAIMAIIPFALCIGLSTIFGCGGIFASGVFYGLMALGKKADREQMMENAIVSQGTTGTGDAYKMESNLVENEQKPADNPFAGQVFK